MTQNKALPQDLLDWIETTADGKITGFRRHNARREAWAIDLERNGQAERLFLRIDRALANGLHSTRNLHRETLLIQALADHDIPAQRILGWNDRHCAALQSWVPGTGALQNEPREHQQAVMLEFMDIVARMHRIDVTALQIPGFEVPTTPLQHSLLEIEAVEEPQLFPVSACSSNPLAAFGKRWLINHAPTRVQATSLVQGDTGPGNFMSDGDHVTALVDWEWAHFGDPMEDLGNIWLRDFFNPSSGGDLRACFERYAHSSGLELQYDSIFYYRVHQLVRSVIGLVYLTEHLDWKTPVPMNLGYRAVIDIETCAAMAEWAGLPLRQAKPLPETPDDAIHATLARQMNQLVLPQLDDAFTRSLVQGHADTLHYLALQARHQAEFDAAELDSLRTLLGNDVRDLGQGQKQLLGVIEGLAIADEAPVLEHLYGVAVRQAQLMAPLTRTWSQCSWARIR